MDIERLCWTHINTPDHSSGCVVAHADAMKVACQVFRESDPSPVIALTVDGDMATVASKRHMIDGHGRTANDLECAAGVDERSAPNPGIHTTVEVDQAPTPVVDGILVMDELLPKRTVEADIFDADFLQVREGAHLPVMPGIDTGVERFIHADAIALDFSNAVLFSEINPFCP